MPTPTPTPTSTQFDLFDVGACNCTTTSNCCLITCSPCALPRKDLQLVATNVITGNETLDLAWDGTSWSTGCDSISGCEFTLACTGGSIDFRVIYWLSGSCASGGTSQYCGSLRSNPYALTLASSTCSPLSLTYTLNSTTCPTVSSSGFTQFAITDPNPVSNPPGLMCCSVYVSACLAYQGVTVSVYSAMGGTLLASGTTGSTGRVYLSWQGAAGTYYVTATGWSSRFSVSTLSQSITLACAAAVTFNLTPYILSGYECTTLCADPVSDNLVITGYTDGGTFPSPRSLVWGAFGSQPNGWYDTVGQVYMTTAGVLGYWTGSGTTFNPISGPTSVTCPPALDLVYPGGSVTE
jgi:hypothetical protein